MGDRGYTEPGLHPQRRWGAGVCDWPGTARVQEHQQEPPSSGPCPCSLAVPADGTKQRLDEQMAAAEPTQDISRVPLKHAQETELPRESTTDHPSCTHHPAQPESQGPGTQACASSMAGAATNSHFQRLPGHTNLKQERPPGPQPHRDAQHLFPALLSPSIHGVCSAGGILKAFPTSWGVPWEANMGELKPQEPRHFLANPETTSTFGAQQKKKKITNTNHSSRQPAESTQHPPLQRSQGCGAQGQRVARARLETTNFQCLAILRAQILLETILWPRNQA